MRLLVVEDEHSLREDIARKLRLSGYEVDACADGEAALEALTAERYDLVLLDLNLPKVDGMQGGDFLLSAVEKGKRSSSRTRYKTLTADAEKIRDIENQIAALAPRRMPLPVLRTGHRLPSVEGNDWEQPGGQQPVCGQRLYGGELLVQRLQALRGELDDT